MWAPQVDIFKRGNELVVHADLAGLKQEDVRVNVDRGVLTISGERRHEHEHDKGGVYQCERSYGAFQRALTLPLFGISYRYAARYRALARHRPTR
jgi:HSP20 family protein